MRILHLEASKGLGGQEMRILKEMEGMRERGHSVFLGAQKGAKILSYARKASFVTFELNFRRLFWPFTLLKLLFILQKEKIELVNTHSSLDAWIGGIAARIKGCKIIRTRHISAPIRPGFNSRILYGSLADFVVTTCSNILPMIANQSKKSQELCQCVATGVDPKKISYSKEDVKAFREKLDVKPEDFLVGMVCVMRSWKGIVDFLKAADLLRNEPNLRWVIIGGGHSETYIQKANMLKLDSIVSFTGHLDNPYPAIGALDLFALLSTANEGISQAILQAAFLEKPLLATKTGGLGEVCIDGLTGLSVPTFSPDIVAQKVLELKKKRDLRKKFGENGKKLVEERFTLEKTLDSMEEISKKVIASYS